MNTATAEGRHSERARPTVSIGGLLFLVGPLLWAVLVLFHPNPTEASPYVGIKDVVDRWLVVHVGQLILAPFVFLAVWRLLDGLHSVAAMVSRGALVVWAVFFSAYDTVQGIATGLLVRYANGLAGEEQSAVAGALEYLVSDSQLGGNISVLALLGQGSWVVVAIAAAVALHKAGAGRAVVAATCLSVLFAIHTAPAAAGMLALVVAGLLRERQRAKSASGSPGVAPTGDAPVRAG
jgi:hypothetical protein